MKIHRSQYWEKTNWKLMFAINALANSVKNEDLQFLNGIFNDIQWNSKICQGVHFSGWV